MKASGNKELMRAVLNELSIGNDRPFVEAMAEDIRWIWMGSGEWEKTFNGKSEVLGTLWSAVRQTLKHSYRIAVQNLLADEDYVIVEATGLNQTPDDRPYQNKYCWVCRFQHGKIAELREYMDTELVTRTFSEAPINILGEKFLFDFGLNKAVVNFLPDQSMQFTITEKGGRPCQETELVKINMILIRPNVYLTTWQEKNANTITQVQDFQNKTVYSNWTLPGGEFINDVGIISPIAASAG